MYKRILFSLVVYLFSGFLLAQNPDKPVRVEKPLDKPMNRLGLSASTMSGVGLNFLHIFDNNLGAKLIWGAYYHEKDANQSNFYNSTGLELQYTVFETKVARFYPLIGFNFRYEQEKSANLDKITRNYTMGIGWGVELLIARLISVHGEIGYHFLRHADYNYYVNIVNDTGDFIGQDLRYIGIGVGAAVAF